MTVVRETFAVYDEALRTQEGISLADLECALFVASRNVLSSILEPGVFSAYGFAITT